MIKIPSRLLKKLQLSETNTLEGELKKITNIFSQIYGENQLYFFNEYTDHGYRHINSVLTQIDILIPNDTLKILSARDILILVLSVFLHDLGMHIQPLTFAAMLEGEYNNAMSAQFEDKPWPILWEEYVEEIKKLSLDDIKKIFSSDVVELNIPDIKNIDQFTEIDKKIIGEFIRRHHPRMAFEIAFIGLKGNDGCFIDLCDTLNSDFRFLSGLVARSHGMDVRKTFKILQNNYPGGIWSRPLNTHIIFLMILLRISDYLQIDDSRILKIPYKTKIFKSPISLLEHKKHFNVVSVQELPNDTETLFFNSSPENSLLYVSLTNLFKAIQNELDVSWAILGEVYVNTIEKNNNPKLKYRRIKTNLEEIELLKTLKFVPELITFSADKELLKLLIAPLYGNEPSYGIRELLQNSIDACWEREFIENSKNTTYDGKVNIEFNIDENKRTIFCIQDNGKGMNINEIKNYFLKAGASLKKSEEWKKAYMNQKKMPSIHRIGKFGIGVLAAYLLGDEIEVETRHMHSDVGYVFNAKINNDNIEVFKSTKIDIGTKIKIYISDGIRNKLFKPIRDRLKIDQKESYFNKDLRWDKWFTLDNPKINIQIYNFPEFSPYAYPNPSKIDKIKNDDWKSFSTNEFERILWSYNNNYTNVFLTCNGIVIPNNYELKTKSSLNFHISKPFISVFDFKGNLPLELNRFSLATKYLPFEDDLLNKIFDDIIKCLLNIKIDIRKDTLIYSGNSLLFEYAGLRNEYNIILCQKGYTLNIPSIVTTTKFKQIIYLDFESNQVRHQPVKIGLTDRILNIGRSHDYSGLTEALGVKEIENKIANDKLTTDYVQKNIIDINKPRNLNIDYYLKRISMQEDNSEISSKFLHRYKEIIGETLFIPFKPEEKKILLEKLNSTKNC